MPSFDYITVKEFRESLEADYTEMSRCAEAQAWKSVQVLAGSIVESLLIDYLASTTNPARSSKDPLKMDLAEAITICRSEKVLSDRTADLCSVVRSYRNLIHPGRMVRLNEQAPDKGSATIALALIDKITDDLAKVLRAAVGLTGEQILSKIQRDANSLTILKHLLAEVSEHQRERLLLELIPSAHEEASIVDDPFNTSFSDTADRLKTAYRIILETVTPETRKRIASKFVSVLREADGERVLNYGKAFFKASDMKFVPNSSLAMVREHLLGQVSGAHTLASLAQIKGIAPYLEPSEVAKWLDPYIRTLVSSAKEVVKERAKKDLNVTSLLGTLPEVDAAIIKRLDEWIHHFEGQDNLDNAELVRQLKKDMEDIPF